MSETQEVRTIQEGGTPRWIALAVAALALISVVGLGLAWNAHRQSSQNEEVLATEVQDLRQTLDMTGRRLEETEAIATQAKGELSVVTERLQLTQAELNRARAQTRQVRAEYSKKLAEVETEVRGELATKADAEAVNALSGDVSGVRSDLDATREHLSMARGELGTLIARNSEEIEQLRRIGLRDYFEFDLNGKGSRYQAGDIIIELRGTNTKRNHFTVRLYVDDLRLEKKNRSINEPIYFYTRGSRAPLELVVNQVAKNRAVGYISVPKAASTLASSN